MKSRTLFLSDTKRINRAYVDKDLPLIFYLHGFSEGAPGTNGSSAIEMRDGDENLNLKKIGQLNIFFDYSFPRNRQL